MNHNNQTLICVGGLCGAGKTTFIHSRYPNFPCIDILQSHHIFPNAPHAYIWAHFTLCITEAFRHSQVVMAEAAFTSSQIERIQRFCETHKYTLKIYWIDVPREVALARIQEDARRHANDPDWLPYHEVRVRIAREMNAPETTKNLPIQFLDQNFDIRKDSKP